MRGDAVDARGELFHGKKFPTPLKTPIIILYRLRRFSSLHRVALALSHCYRVASYSKTVIIKRFYYSSRLQIPFKLRFAL